MDFIKLKSETLEALKRIRAHFDATVAVPVDDKGRPLPRPTVKWIHSDREGALLSNEFKKFRAEAGLHHTMSAPHDHDLNPIAERTIGVISELATAIRHNADAPIGFWPSIIGYAVDWHNSMTSAHGSSSADANISPHQRHSGRPPKVMDLAAFGCCAVALNPPTKQHKPSLKERGSLGIFLGRSLGSRGCWDVWVPSPGGGGNVISTSSVQINEEYFDWSPPERRHRPLTSLSHARGVPARPTLQPEGTVTSSVAAAPSAFEAVSELTALELFSGKYCRPKAVKPKTLDLGWKRVDQIDATTVRPAAAGRTTC